MTNATNRSIYFKRKDVTLAFLLVLYGVIGFWGLCGQLLRNGDGKRPVHGQSEKFQTDPHWRDLLLFYEYFHGDNGSGIGASHQTGWTGLVAKLIQQSGE